MGCFFGCLRIEDDTHLISDAVSSKRRDPISRNQLAYLLLSEETEDSPYEDKDTVHCSLGTPCQDSDYKKLKNEAKFLKACGTLLETPAEIRKALEETKDLPPHEGDSETSKFQSWLPTTSIKKLHCEQPIQAPVSSVKLYEEMGKESGFLEHKPSRVLKLVGRNCTRSPEGSGVEIPDTPIKIPIRPIDNDTFSSVTLKPPTVTTQCKNKSVRFECESDMAVLPSSGQSSKQSDSPGSHNGSKRSPYPTPVKLTNEMQTPGTIYPANIEKLANGRNARIRSQYVYPVLNPIQNFSQLKALREEDSYTHKKLGQLGESLEQSENASPECTSVCYSSKSASVSHWIKPSSSLKDGRDQNCGAMSSKPHSGKTPYKDRPILGTVAAHWNEDEPSHSSPKWWDGNGIPNSNTKYKEDQKVSWHATPFEVRLEKALSDEIFVHQSPLNGRSIHFEDNEESDTAVSRLQSSAHPESIV